jgi:hypothetical protein
VKRPRTQISPSPTEPEQTSPKSRATASLPAEGSPLPRRLPPPVAASSMSAGRLLLAASVAPRPATRSSPGRAGGSPLLSAPHSSPRRWLPAAVPPGRAGRVRRRPASPCSPSRPARAGCSSPRTRLEAPAAPRRRLASPSRPGPPRAARRHGPTTSRLPGRRRGRPPLQTQDPPRRGPLHAADSPRRRPLHAAGSSRR